MRNPILQSMSDAELKRAAEGALRLGPGSQFAAMCAAEIKARLEARAAATPPKPLKVTVTLVPLKPEEP